MSFVAIDPHRPPTPPPELQRDHVAESVPMCRSIGNALYETAAKAALFVVAGIVAQILFSALAPPFFVLAGAIFLTRIVVKICSQFNLPTFHHLNDRVADFNNRYPWFQVVALICVLAVALLSTIAAVILAGGLGIICGFVLNIEVTRRNQDTRREEIRSDQSTALHALNNV